MLKLQLSNGQIIEVEEGSTLLPLAQKLSDKYASPIVMGLYNGEECDLQRPLTADGTVDFMDDDDVLEIAAVIGKDGAEPVAIDKVDNRHIIGLMRVVKAYEKYTVEAATTGSEAAAINALLVHPLVGDWEKAHKCFEEMKWAHKAYLPEFFPNDVVIKC